MSLKPRYKRRIFWSILSILALIGISIVVVPPMITLNNLKPKIEQALTEKIGIPAKIQGDINFSLLGKATIVAHDIEIPKGIIDSAMFSIPFYSIFNLDNAKLSGDISLYGANISIEKLTPQSLDFHLKINNSDINFLGKNYELISGVISDGQFSGTIRTNNHKYEIDLIGNDFYIRNQNDKLQAEGILFPDGSTSGKLSIETDNINKLFGFNTPRINRTVSLTANFEWDGGKGIKFTDIESKNFSGNIEILPSGKKEIQLYATNIDFDFSFLLDPSRIYYETDFNIDFYGKLKFANRTFSHLKVVAKGTKNKINITKVIADDITFTGGYIDETGAHSIIINFPYQGSNFMCFFSGTPDNWKCSSFTYENMTGSLSVSKDGFNIFIQSDKPMPSQDSLKALVSRFGDNGTVNFQFSDIGGTFYIKPESKSASYTFAKNKSLKWLGTNFNFLPKFMYDQIGNFEWEKGALKFIPNAGNWSLYLSENYFYLNGTNIKDLIPTLDLQSINDSSYIISGSYNKDTISSLNIKVDGHDFSGSLSGKNLTLKTSVLNIDSFINQQYLDNYEELEFTTQNPILLIFDLPINISLSADTVIYSGSEYNNFAYSLKNNKQTFSITDNDKGSLLATITKDKNKYEIFIQSNKFVINDYLLSKDMPLNIKDTIITAEIQLNTYGNIAHDISYNLSGDFDLSFDGGVLEGIGIDDFYGYAENITTFNSEYVLSAMLESGSTAIKKMRIIGKYQDGNFETTRPFNLSMRHSEATGNVEIKDKQMYVDMTLILRGTSPEPSPIELEIYPNNVRKYSLSDIMMKFDTSYMRDFVKTHNKF